MITAFFNHLYLSVKANFDIQDLNWMCKVSFMFTVDLFDQELYTRMNIEEEKKKQLTIIIIIIKKKKHS